MNVFQRAAMSIASVTTASVNTTQSRDVNDNVIYHKVGFFTDGKGALMPLASIPPFTVMGITVSLSEDKDTVIFTAGNCGVHSDVQCGAWKKELWAILSLDPAEISAVFKSASPRIWRTFRASAGAADALLSQKELIDVGFDINEMIKGSMDLVTASSCDQEIKDGAKSIFDKTNREPTPGWDKLWDGKE